jgi:hypothetical protein
VSAEIICKPNRILIIFAENLANNGKWQHFLILKLRFFGYVLEKSDKNPISSIFQACSSIFQNPYGNLPYLCKKIKENERDNRKQSPNRFYRESGETDTQAFAAGAVFRAVAVEQYSLFKEHGNS